MSISKNNSNGFFSLENSRQLLAMQMNDIELEKTYRSKFSLSNDNTGEFWDGKFFSTHEQTLSNPMERDRNTTACAWFSHIVSNGFKTLNIGCGDGNFEELISNIPTAFEHTGADIATKTIRRLKSKFKRFKFISFNVIDDEFKKKYDVISLFEVLEHIQTIHTLKVLRKINKALENGGIFLLSVPMNEGLDVNYPYNPNEHQRMYTPDLIFSELRIAGFEVIRFKTFFAFSNYYRLKSFIANNLLVTKWKPNNILVLCKKP